MLNRLCAAGTWPSSDARFASVHTSISTHVAALHVLNVHTLTLNARSKDAGQMLMAHSKPGGAGANSTHNKRAGAAALASGELYTLFLILHAIKKKHVRCQAA